VEVACRLVDDLAQLVAGGEVVDGRRTGLCQLSGSGTIMSVNGQYSYRVISVLTVRGQLLIRYVPKSWDSGNAPTTPFALVKRQILLSALSHGSAFAHYGPGMSIVRRN
jgi:hypothetical protein